MRRALALLLLCGSLASATRLVLLSDFNGSYGSTRYPAPLSQVIRRILHEWKPDAVLSAGDLVAGQKASLTEAQLDQLWSAFQRDIQQPLLAAEIPFIFTLGNHDAGLPSDRRAAARYWASHRPTLEYQDRAAFPFRYSLRFRELFIAVLDASGPQVGIEQQRWLSQQLMSSPAQQARYRLVLGHLPLAGVSREKNKPGEIIAQREALHRILSAGRAIYVHGHHAAYFPGQLRGLPVLASGGIGGRDYVGHPGSARSVVTVLDFGEDRLDLNAHDAETGTLIPLDRLPTSLEGIGGPLERLDHWAP